MSYSSWLRRRRVARTRHTLLTLLVAALISLGSIAPASTAQAVNPPPTTVGICPATEADLTSTISSLGPGSTIQFTCDETLALTSTILIPENLEIDGHGHNVTISGNNSVGVFVVNAAVSADLSDLTIANGHAGSGGGIDNLGSLTVGNCTIISNTVSNLGGGIYNTGQLTTFGTTISGNQAFIGAGVYNNGGVVLLDVTTLANNTASDYGAGVYNINNGMLTVQSSTVSGNSATAGATFGNGINNASGSAAIDQSTITNNSANGHNALGGGIYNNGPMTITNSTISSNSVSDPSSPPFAYGGGIMNYNGGDLSVSNSTIDNNTSNDSGGGISNQGTMNVTGSTLNGNNAAMDGGAALNFTTLTISTSTLGDNIAAQGGGVYNQGTTTIGGSTFSGNSASVFGGGIYNLSTVNLTNSTFSGNSASAFGGGLYAQGATTVGNSTFSGNSAVDGGASVAFQNVTANLSNSILAGSGPDSECYGSIHDNGGNLSDDASCALTQSTSTNNATALNLGALANNGGSTQTIALLPGSSASDIVPLVNCPSSDQRGLARPDTDVAGETACDSGAFESGNAPAPTNTPTPTTTPTATNTPTPTATNTPTAHLVISPAHVAPFQTLALTGTGFLAGQTVRVSLDSITGTALLTPTVNAAGQFTGTLSAPQAISGTHVLLAAGLPSGPGAYALLQVSPEMILSPRTGAISATVTGLGFGFGRGEPVRLYWDKPVTLLGTTASNAVGSFYAGTALTFKVPTGAAAGRHYVIAIGLHSGARAYAAFTVH